MNIKQARSVLAMQGWTKINEVKQPNAQGEYGDKYINQQGQIFWLNIESVKVGPPLKQTMAQSLLGCDDFNLLWADVETVDRTGDGDLYTYPDHSQLLINKDGTARVI